MHKLLASQSSLISLRRFRHPGFQRGARNTRLAIEAILKFVEEAPVSMWVNHAQQNYQAQLEKEYNKIFGPFFQQAFKDVFGVAPQSACALSDYKLQLSTQFVVFSNLAIADLDNYLFDQSIFLQNGYQFTRNYNPWWIEQSFDFGFVVADKYDNNAKIVLRVDIPLVHIKSTKVTNFIMSPEGRKIFSNIQKVWQLANHDNTIHNNFFLSKKWSHLNSNGIVIMYLDNKSTLFRFKYPPFFHPKYGNFYEMWAIHAHRDLIYDMYKLYPEFKKYVLSLGASFMKALEIVKDKELYDDLLELFAYPYWRIIDIAEKEFNEGCLRTNSDLCVSDSFLPILAQAMENSRVAKWWESHIWNRIHDESNPKLIDAADPVRSKIYYTHTDVLSAYQY